MSRLALSDTDKQARDWFVSTVHSLGCTTKIDTMGNIFAIRPSGRAETRDAPPVYAGSHLDTQPTGGRYDGILGVTAGLEMLKVLNDNHVETEFPVGVVNWTNEEGARFPISMVSSGVWSGDIPLERAHNLEEVIGSTSSDKKKPTMKSELQRIGYLGKVPTSHHSTPMAAHFELHIEQGPILESSNRKIGIVHGVQSYRWFTVEIKGRDCHTGTTPFANRADPLLLASKLILYSHKAATARNALASTGILTLRPGSTNTVPGTVRFSLDIRSHRDSIVEEVEVDLREAFEAINRGASVSGLNEGVTPSQPCKITWTTDSVSPAVLFHDDCIQCVTDSCESIFGSREEAERLTVGMTSGAGHDSVYTSRRCPTSMIFIPCKDGVSHNPAEYSKPEDCALGATVLLQSVLRFDRQRARK